MSTVVAYSFPYKLSVLKIKTSQYLLGLKLIPTQGWSTECCSKITGCCLLCPLQAVGIKNQTFAVSVRVKVNSYSRLEHTVLSDELPTLSLIWRTVAEKPSETEGVTKNPCKIGSVTGLQIKVCMRKMPQIIHLYSTVLTSVYILDGADVRALG
jgi:hypothetical protein